MKTITLLLLVSFFLFHSASAHAKKQTILVKIKSCEKIKIKVINGSECVADDFIGGACKDIDECLCVSPDKEIKWRIVSKIDNKIKIKFKDENGNKIKSPFKNQCCENFNGDKAVCKLKTKPNLNRQYYDFFVKVKGCRNDHDPRIIIRSQQIN